MTQLTNVEAKAITKPGRHADGGGLYLNVTATGTRSWLFMWKRGGRRREMGLGSYPTPTLAKARRIAAEHRALVQDGGDPIAQRERAAEPTFAEAVEAYLDAMEGEWTNPKHRYQWGQTLGPAYCQPILNRRVFAIDLTDVLKVLKPVWGEKPETASRLRGRIERVLNYAKVRAWREGENPALWRGNLENVLPRRKRSARAHQPAMPYADVPAFAACLADREALTADALRFLILMAARTGEVLGMMWDEADIESAVWTVPAERMKARREHRVPLTDEALAILQRLHAVRLSAYVFPGQNPRKPLSNMALAMLMRRMKVENAVPHGFRSSFRDWAGDETSFPREVAEGCLAHVIGNAIEQAYRRGDALAKRRALLEAWSVYLHGREPSNVVSLHA